jgi:predicted RNase H-like HicB family nuclease
MRYPVVIHKEKGSAYGVTVPDIPGCFSAGDTLDEAFANAREAIFAHLELVTESGGDVADARSIEEHHTNKDYAGGTWAFVDVDIEDLLGPAERVNVTIPKRALQKIDMAAKRRGDTRSGLLTRAALDFISISGGTFVKKEAGRQRSVYAGPIVGERTTRKAAGPTAMERAPKASVSRAKRSVAKTRKSA